VDCAVSAASVMQHAGPTDNTGAHEVLLSRDPEIFNTDVQLSKLQPEQP